MGRLVQHVEDRQHHPAGEAEQDLHALLEEHLVEDLRPAFAGQAARSRRSGGGGLGLLRAPGRGFL